jgi:hypothetical protein
LFEHDRFISALSFLRLENMTVTYDEHVQFRCQLPRNFSRRENILQWKKLRSHDDDLIISINGKVPKTLEVFYRTDLNDQWSTLELFHVNRHDSTTYVCQTFETQTILCQYNLIVLSKFARCNMSIALFVSNEMCQIDIDKNNDDRCSSETIDWLTSSALPFAFLFWLNSNYHSFVSSYSKTWISFINYQWRNDRRRSTCHIDMFICQWQSVTLLYMVT